MDPSCGFHQYYGGLIGDGIFTNSTELFLMAVSGESEHPVQITVNVEQCSWPRLTRYEFDDENSYFRKESALTPCFRVDKSDQKYPIYTECIRLSVDEEHKIHITLCDLEGNWPGVWNQNIQCSALEEFQVSGEVPIYSWFQQHGTTEFHDKDFETDCNNNIWDSGNFLLSPMQVNTLQYYRPDGFKDSLSQDVME